ncbi:MAG: MBL fold metallo-hydrolase, partial [Angelakisella sp.]
DSECECHIYGPRHEGMDCEEILGKLFAPPFWPIALDKLPAKLSFHSFDVVEEMPLGDDITLGFLPLNHPNGAFGFRLCHGGKVFCYVLDHEHTPEYSHLLSAFVHRCDLLLCDATYTAEEYDRKRGFGHSAMETMAEFAETAEVKRLLLSHHGTDKTDAMLSVLEARLHRDYPHCAFARDGMEVLL